MSSPLVTVLTPTYNHERFIDKCIHSVLAQTFNDWEQIIVDDGSTDGTERVINRFKDERIRYVKQSHVGIGKLSETYNRGLKMARGDLIALLEGDDMFPKRKLELQFHSLDDDTVLSFGRYILVDENNKYLGYFPLDSRQYLRTTDWLKPMLISCFISSTTVMIRKDALLKVGGFIQPVGINCVDQATYLELALIGKFKFIDETLGIWVKHGDNWSDRNMDNHTFLNYGVTFCRKHNIPIDWKAIREQHGRDLFHIGRHQLLKGMRTEANLNFRRSFKLSSTSGKLKALIGLGMSKTGMDFEGIADWLGRPTER
jgi:glycosyltransferase involved in cell wall biosynthesis